MAPEERPKKTPYADEWLNFENQAGGRFVVHGTVQDMREQFDTLLVQLKSSLPPPRDDVITQDRTTTSGIPVRIYKPVEATSGLPVGLYIHSGGFICGSIDGEDHIARDLAARVPCVLASVEYRLAPENPFPAALDDCISALKWTAEEASSLGGDPTKLFTIGGSAGGNLALTTALGVAESSENNSLAPPLVFAACAAFYIPQAVRDLPPELQAYIHPNAYEDAAIVNKSIQWTVCAQYLQDNDAANPLISPIFHPKLADLTYIYITTSNKDPHNDDAYMLRHKLRSLGVEHSLLEYDGWPHFFHMFPQLEASKRFMSDITQAIRQRLK